MSFAEERAVKAVRKRHRCEGCLTPIEIGSPAMRWAGVTDGEFGTAIYHPECREAEVALNDLMDWRWGDEWWPLHEIEHDSYEWLLVEHPVVAARMKIAERVA